MLVLQLVQPVLFVSKWLVLLLKGYVILLVSFHKHCLVIGVLFTFSSVDFNSKDGTCWGHTDIDLKCDFLSPLNEVYHMKKSPVCGKLSYTFLNNVNIK